MLYNERMDQEAKKRGVDDYGKAIIGQRGCRYPGTLQGGYLALYPGRDPACYQAPEISTFLNLRG